VHNVNVIGTEEKCVLPFSHSWHTGILRDHESNSNVYVVPDIAPSLRNHLHATVCPSGLRFRFFFSFFFFFSCLDSGRTRHVEAPWDVIDALRGKISYSRRGTGTNDWKRTHVIHQYHRKHEVRMPAYTPRAPLACERSLPTVVQKNPNLPILIETLLVHYYY
jgi:hypothetical protein